MAIEISREIAEAGSFDGVSFTAYYDGRAVHCFVEGAALGVERTGKFMAAADLRAAFNKHFDVLKVITTNKLLVSGGDAVNVTKADFDQYGNAVA